MINVSIVTFENNEEILLKAVQSALDCPDVHLIIVDNSITDKMKLFFSSLNNPRIEFIKMPMNVGFGTGHNVAIRLSLERKTTYHLALNPDIFFEPGTLEKLQSYMDQRPEVGLIMPQILDPDGELQYLCKNRPRPFDLFARRFLPSFIKNRLQKRFDKFEMRDRDYSNIIEAPCLSGCFMFFRTSIFQTLDLFDERYFMYMEDLDISQRISEKFKTLYYPDAKAYHYHAKGSYKNKKLLWYHIRSAIKYFNKWGWWPLF